MLTKYKLGELVDVTRGMSLPGEKYSESGELIRLTLGNFNYNGGGFKENTSKSDSYYIGEVKSEYRTNFRTFRFYSYDSRKRKIYSKSRCGIGHP